MSEGAELSIVHAPERGGFYLMDSERKVGELEYHRAGPKRVVVYHTEVVPRLRGKGQARRLVDALVGWARIEGIAIGATCWYARDVLEGDPACADVWAP